MQPNPAFQQQAQPQGGAQAYPQGSAPAFPQLQNPQQQSVPQPTTTAARPPGQEESYIENILRLNKGKVATFYLTFENNREWNAKVVTGVIEAAGRDHIIVSDPATGRRYLLLLIYLDYVTFEEEINYFQ